MTIKKLIYKIHKIVIFNLINLDVCRYSFGKTFDRF